MKRTYSVWLFLSLTTFLLSQSNPVPPINQGARVEFQTDKVSHRSLKQILPPGLTPPNVLLQIRPNLRHGSAKYATSKLLPGTNSITAVYGGDSNKSGSASAPVNQFVLAATSATLTSSLNPSNYGQAVTFTAKVTSSIGAPPDGDTVTFKKGTTVLGMGTLNGGTATFTTSTLKVGTTSVAAAYGGDSNFAGSKSNTVKQVVVNTVK